MKKLVLMALAAAALSAGSASAQYPPPYAPAPYGPAPGQYAPAPYGPAPGQYAPAPYGPGGPVVASSQPGCSTCGSGEAVTSKHGGFHPFLRKFFGIGGGPAERQTLPTAQPGQGQLAFPQNPFIRSPRDFFMY